jgi:hypothetical protein
MGPCLIAFRNCFLGATTTQDHFVSLQVVAQVILLCMLLRTDICMGARHLPKGILQGTRTQRSME